MTSESISIKWSVAEHSIQALGLDEPCLFQVQWRRAIEQHPADDESSPGSGSSQGASHDGATSAAHMWVFLSELSTECRATKTLLTPGCSYQFRVRSAKLRNHQQS